MDLMDNYLALWVAIEFEAPPEDAFEISEYLQYRPNKVHEAVKRNMHQLHVSGLTYPEIAFLYSVHWYKVYGIIRNYRKRVLKRERQLVANL